MSNLMNSQMLLDRRPNRTRRMVKHQVHGSGKMRRLKKELVIKNLKLYMKNMAIIKENEVLRKKAIVLDQENKSLFHQLQNVSQRTLGSFN
ncbi:hypothetical protein Leryth_025937 [Lithospermum erythrorhizon]|nr:hypothetical protein Leryth_025937 [Lithospermum erythrorhizon]